MAISRMRDILKLSQVSRVHPEFEQHKDHPRHHHDDTASSSSDTIWYSSEYTSASISNGDTRSWLSPVFISKVQSPSIRVVRMGPHVVDQYQQTVEQQDAATMANRPTPSLSSPARSFFYWSSVPSWRKGSSTPPSIAIRKVDKQTSTSGMKKALPTITPKTPKKISKIIVFGALALGLAVGVIAILATWIAFQPTNISTSISYMSSACAASCMMSLTSFHAATIASWPFDSSLSDLNNIYSGSYTLPSVTYVTGNIGQAISLPGSQYVYSNTQFLNLTYQSWTLEGWIWMSDVSSERGIFGQCQSSTTTDQCLSITIRNRRLHFGFNNDDVDGATVLTTTTNKWYHVAFVYDYTLMRQSVYLDGILDGTTGASGVFVGPYKGTSGQVTIGSTNSGNYFSGYIDQLQVSSGAKTACQILNDATLTAYYPFDTGASYLDSSVNFLNGVAISLISVSGRVNQAYSFQTVSSYFQSVAFTGYSSGESFSVALWIKPYFVNGGTLIHLSTDAVGTGTACFDLLGFSSSGQLIGQLYSSYDCCVCCTVFPFPSCPCYGSTNVAGPNVTVNTWLHIVLTYSSSNGMALYTNGTLRGVTAPFSSFPSSPAFTTRPFMTVGNPSTTSSSPSCLTGSPALSPTAYQGIIDELRVYSRELTITEICSLFNP